MSCSDYSQLEHLFVHDLHELCMYIIHFVVQTDIVDDIPTVKFVYIQWVGNDVKPLSKAKISTHKGALEEMFYVSLSLLVQHGSQL